MTENTTDARLRALEIQQSATNEAIIAIKDAIQSFKKNTDELVSFARKQVQIEERQVYHAQALDRAFKAIKSNDERVVVIEKEMPTTILARGWVFMAMTGIVALAGAYIGTHL